ncbi:MAG: bifunctional helix-turn-helix transcriptional regulator/GNAT family N-acetyltransferase [Pseudomonadota bacterium]
MTEAVLTEQIGAVRRFNRFFTRKIGVLREGLLHSPYSLTEARVIFELAQQSRLTASDLCKELGLDPGYVSRVLNKLEEQGLVEKIRSDNDRRQRLICLTDDGRNVFSMLDQRSNEEIAEMLNELNANERARLLEAIQNMEALLDRGFKYAAPFYLRHHEPGDMGWVIGRHGLLYNREYGWDQGFEAFVAGICADFINNFDPARECCWIAEMQGEQVGSIFCKKESEAEAKLRMLLVDPKARNLGLGTRLVQECLRFAQRKGYKKISLWTNDILVEARKIYEKCGFKLIREESHQSFGQDLVGQYWELPL